MDRFHQLVVGVSLWSARLSGMLLLLAAVVIGVDVLMRLFFNHSIGGADELSGYALAIATAWGLAFTLLHRAHIRIDSLYELAGPRIRVLLDLFSLLGFMIFLALIVWHASGVLSQSIASDARSISALEIRLAVPQAAWLAGLAFTVAVAALLLAETAVRALRGDISGALGLVGAKAATEEVKEELTAAGRRFDAGECA